MTVVFAAIAALGVYWTVAGGALILWAAWALVRLPFDLNPREGRDDW